MSCRIIPINPSGPFPALLFGPKLTTENPFGYEFGNDLTLEVPDPPNSLPKAVYLLPLAKSTKSFDNLPIDNERLGKDVPFEIYAVQEQLTIIDSTNDSGPDPTVAMSSCTPTDPGLYHSN